MPQIEEKVCDRVHSLTGDAETSPAMSSIRREKDRRSEPRMAPRPGKHVTIYVTTTVEVKNESKGGMCLKLPLESQIEIGETLTIRDEGFNRLGRVCWTSISAGYRLVGFSWVDSETPTSRCLDKFPIYED